MDIAVVRLGYKKNPSAGLSQPNRGKRLRYDYGLSGFGRRLEPGCRCFGWGKSAFRFLESFVNPPLQLLALHFEPCQFIGLAPLAASDVLQHRDFALYPLHRLLLLLDKGRQFV